MIICHSMIENHTLNQTKLFHQPLTKMRLPRIIFLFCIFNQTLTSAQDFTQTIRGRVIDKQSQVPLPGANVAVINGKIIEGTVTGPDGYFEIKGLPLGRHHLQISYVGYLPANLTNLNFTSGKELVLEIELVESVENLDEVVVKASGNKKGTNNTMATISARTFSVEESQRFAGARNDVARMATNYAGVSTANDAVNDIVIRGNSPNGLLWRLEGIEIPNPNHFGFIGQTGGPVGMLNNNVLANSDFLTGAFPAEYGDCFSGVFDLKMRNGNFKKHEFLGQIGFNGFEAGAEGPVSKKNNSSYLINYRLSTLEVMSKLGMEFGTGTAIPYYQDLALKVNFPTKNTGKFSIFGMGGINHIDLLSRITDTTETAVNYYNEEHLDIYNKNKVGVLGINHFYPVNASTYTKFTLATTTIHNSNDIDSTDVEDLSKHPFVRSNYSSTNFIAAFYLNKKYSSKLNLRAGINYKHMMDNISDGVYEADKERFEPSIDRSGSAQLLQLYLQSQYRFTNNLIINAGIHSQLFELNDLTTLEPRAGIKYILNTRHRLSFGYGYHSMLPSIYHFYYPGSIQNDITGTLNTSLSFFKSHHYVLAYDWSINPTLRLKIESYYQDITDAPVDNKSNSFSLLNDSRMNVLFTDSLEMGGTGRNYGLEITFEKFMDKGFYYLFTASLFDSKYRGSDGQLRSTAFDNKYVVNILGGKEFALNSKKEDGKNKKWIVVDARVSAAGGQRYTPLDLEASYQAGEARYDHNRAFSEKFKDYFRADLRIAFRMDSRRVSQEWAFDVQNITNRSNPLYMTYDKANNSEKYVYQMAIFPMMQYRIMF